VIEREPPAPVRFGQMIDANAPAKSAAVEYSRMISELRERHLSGHDAGCNRERARMRRFELKIETGEIAGRHRRACEGGPRCDLAHLPLRIEEVDGRVAREPIPLQRQFDLPVETGSIYQCAP
jgi:hypothetical protein